MKIYVDSEFRCHLENPDGVYYEAEDAFFDGKCQTFVEGYCYDDSKGYPKIYPWQDYDELDAAQRQYEQEQLADMRHALEVMGVTLNE